MTASGSTQRRRDLEFPSSSFTSSRETIAAGNRRCAIYRGGFAASLSTHVVIHHLTYPKLQPGIHRHVPATTFAISLTTSASSVHTLSGCPWVALRRCILG